MALGEIERDRAGFAEGAGLVGQRRHPGVGAGGEEVRVGAVREDLHPSELVGDAQLLQHRVGDQGVSVGGGIEAVHGGPPTHDSPSAAAHCR